MVDNVEFWGKSRVFELYRGPGEQRDIFSLDIVFGSGTLDVVGSRRRTTMAMVKTGKGKIQDVLVRDDRTKQADVTDKTGPSKSIREFEPQVPGGHRRVDQR